MAIKVYESADARRWNGDDFEYRLTIEGTEDDAEARWTVLANSPVIWDGRLRQAPTIEQTGPETWEATITYTANEKTPEIGDCTLSWQTGGGTQHITQALSTIGKYGLPGESPPENYGAIKAKTDGSGVDGVDILVPDFRWSEKYTVNPGMLTWAYAVTCAYLTGSINAGGFRGFAAGEVQFRGSSADVRLTGQADQPELRAEIQYDFAASPNRLNVQIGTITGIAKKGWELLDVRYEAIEDGAANKLTPKPVAVYVHQVYSEANFNLLGIGS